MASVAITRRNHLLSSLLRCRTLYSRRTITTGRPTFAASISTSPADTETPVSRTKILETFREEFEIGSRIITLETGKIARFANGAVVLGMDDTNVLSTVCSAKGDGVRDFLPLTRLFDLEVDYQEKQFAQGVIPGTYMRREGAPKERELLCGRLIDRPIRPLFPAGFYHEVQVMASVLSSDGKQDPDVMAANATSAALMLSDIPWDGPIGMIRVGRIDGHLVVNPSMDELKLSDLNLVYACTRDKTMMIDVQAHEISEKDLEAAFRFAHPEAVKFIEPQLKLAAKAGKQKKEYTLSLVSDRTIDKIRNLTEKPIEAIFTDPSYGKFERGEALDKIGQDVKGILEEEGDEESLKGLSKTVDTVRKQVVRRRIINEGFRLDGRLLDEVRPLYCEAGNLPGLHGSALFSRGDTQVLCTVTLGAPGDAQRLDSIVGPPTKRFMLHYSFPPYCINEVGKRTGLNRREVGHGTLAEKALLAVLPRELDFPYTVRINSEVMGSDGSTSMATVCGGSMALMDAGIPLKDHVAGLSVGLVTEVDPSTGNVDQYRILTDILGLEDHLGDMDFKIAGTRNGITAIQLDIKPAGIPLDIICESLEPAYKGRLQILERMEQEINSARTQDGRNSPRLVTLKYSNDDLRRLIGPLGALKTKIEEETGARMSVSDGTLTIVAKNQSVMEKVQEKVDLIIGRAIEVGGVYKGIVTSIKEYGAFVEFNGGQHGLLHVSELSHEPVSRISDVISVGQQLSLMCIGQDLRGNIKLSLKATLPQKTKKSDMVDGSLNMLKPKPDSYTPEQEDQNSAVKDLQDDKDTSTKSNPSYSSMAPIVIRSAVECDEEEKSAGLGSNLKPKRALKPKSSQKLKTLKTQSGSDSGSTASKKVRIAKPYLLTEKRNYGDNDTSSDEDKNEVKVEHKNAVLDYLKDRECEVTGPMDAKKLKLGMKVTAKILQVRARGLVLDLGGGINGMYKFESDGGKEEFEVGNEVHVQCTSFTSKGIPVMSIIQDD
ncbi:putative polyribonucleotide nucleotidyltransferase [Helianthus annuus]|nr:putative polyribonucleotide nucleotidyltransferase [Helianthus annuus]KAJ0447261.1 putative polyribonucleotide nucleotidyltransferase [Helianthus annuus]KAJ0632171.1 putative polyribonucleotide nucleotidyltransferase [Helianthus annuus]KAJ0636041.1 putative polyribonucleotide nucleotidyltransferase [Helianthus annuus]KAJ0826007.1 putative polyribonucleotide nucleotidyltransferase [Helianthus annuus]